MYLLADEFTKRILLFSENIDSIRINRKILLNDVRKIRETLVRNHKRQQIETAKLYLFDGAPKASIEKAIVEGNINALLLAKWKHSIIIANLK